MSSKLNPCRLATKSPTHFVLHSVPCLQLISLSALRAEIELVRAKTAASGSSLEACSSNSSSSPASSRQDAASEAAGESMHVAALLEWAQAVCAQYKLPVRNFGACLSDGSVFCLLVSVMKGRGQRPSKSGGRSSKAGTSKDGTVAAAIICGIRFTHRPLPCRSIITWATLMLDLGM